MNKQTINRKDLPVLDWHRHGNRKHSALHCEGALGLALTAVIHRRQDASYFAYIRDENEDAIVATGGYYCNIRRVKHILRGAVAELVDKRRVELRTSVAVSSARIGLVNVS